MIFYFSSWLTLEANVLKCPDEMFLQNNSGGIAGTRVLRSFPA